MRLPTEDEIRDAAKRLGHLDEHGNYPRHLRAKIAATVQLANEEIGNPTAPESGRTAELLARFDAELCAVGLDGEDLRRDLLVEAARHLLKSGLRLDNPTTEEVIPHGP